MRTRPRPLVLAALALLLAAPPARADALKLVSADAGGVTLRLDLPPWRLVPDPLTHRQRIEVSGLDLVGLTGRPTLPWGSALVALPPTGAVSAAVIAEGSEQVIDRTAIAIAGRHGWANDPGGLGIQPTVDDTVAILDGPWPKTALETGAPFVVRHQRVMALRVYPFRYDEATGRLWAKSSITVRVSFAGGGAAALRAPSAAALAPDPVLDRGLVNAEQSRRFRMAAQPARLAPFAAARVGAAGGFDEDNPEARVRVDSTGVLAIAYDDLPAGMFTNVPIAQVSVHRHEFVEGQTPPYETIELPCEVVDFNNDGVFDSGDWIQVYAQTWAKRARASIWQRQWGDADYLYVTTLNARPGLRMSTRAGWNNVAGLTPLASYPQTLHYEHDSGDPTIYNSIPPDTLTDPYNWVQILNYYARPDSFLFTATDVDTSHQAGAAVQIVARHFASLLTYLRVRNGLGQITPVQDSIGWLGAGTVTFRYPFPGSALTEGRNNLEVFGHDQGIVLDPANDVPTYQSLNWYEITLWRAYKAIQGYLPCTSAGASGDYQIRAGRFTSNAIEVWDVTDSTNAVRLTLDPSHLIQNGSQWSVEFQDNAAPGTTRSYVVFDRPRLVTPDAITPVARRSLYAAVGSPDYLLVVPAAWESAVQPLVAARQAQGLDVLVAPYEAIRDEFNGGRASAWAIKRLIKFAYSNWGTRYVALFGDAGGEDPRGMFPNSSHEWLPTMMILSPIYVPSSFSAPGNELIPSDAWYGWCVDPACTDPSLQPKVYDVFVGRLPVNSAAEANAVALKLAKYEQVTPDQTWRRDMLLMSDDQFSTGSLAVQGGSNYCKQPGEAIFAQLNNRIHDIIVNDAGLTVGNTELFDMNVWLASEPADTIGAFICRPSLDATQLRTHANITVPQLVPRINAGRLWWNYQGHANEEVLAHEYVYNTRGSTDDWRLFSNTDRPFFFSAFACHANNFVRAYEYAPIEGPCIGEELVDVPGGGAIASWASSGFEIVPSDNSRPGQPMSHINTELARALFSNVPTDSTFAVRRDPFAHVPLGEGIGLAVLRWAARVPTDPNQRDVGISYELLGDPATRLSIGMPQTTVAVNGVAATSGTPVRLHTLSDTLRVDADVISNQQIRQLWVERTAGARVDSLGVSALTLTPPWPDTARVDAGGRRFHVTFRDTLGLLSYRYRIHSVDYQNVPADFDVALPFQTVLRADGSPTNNGDALAPTVNLSMLVLSPAPVVDPQSALVLRVNGAVQPFTASPNVGDVSGREWVLSWTHAAFPIGDYAVSLDANGVATAAHTFRVTVTSSELRLTNAMLFPNPFDDDLGAFFSFNLESGSPAKVLIRVYTVSGKLVYRRYEDSLAPGYHQLPWDGRDAEGDKLANGVYFYRIEASNGSSNTVFQGSMVKLRKPIRIEPTTP